MDMKRLKALRQSNNYTQQDLAERLKTTQQTIARWESGKAEPSMSALRDIALIFGTSVDDLLEINPFSDKITTTNYHNYRVDEDSLSDGFWGHLGLLLPGQTHTNWFPITQSTAEYASKTLRNIETDEQWLWITTLNNRVLAINPTKTKRIWLLDDAYDAPGNDWHFDIKDDIEGNPLELYRGLSTYFSGTERDMEEFSEDFKKVLESFIKNNDFDEDSAFKYLHYTTIYMTDGYSTSYWANPEQLHELTFDIGLEAVPKIINIDAIHSDFESYYPSSNICVVAMPLIDIIDAAKEEKETDDD